MEQAQLEKIKTAFFQMNNDYWDMVTTKSSNLSEYLKEITKAINDNFIKFAIIQLEILNTKYKGYEHLLSGETNFDEFISENKKCIANLTDQKNQIANEFLKLLPELNAIIEEVQTLGEQ